MGPERKQVLGNGRVSFSAPFLLTNPASLSLQALKGSKKLVLSVYSAGRVPGGYVTNHIYTWVDPQGRSISPPSGLPQPHGSALRQREGDRRSTLHLLQGGDEKKVSCPSLALGGRPKAENWWGRLAPETRFFLPNPEQGSFSETGRRVLVPSGLCPFFLTCAACITYNAGYAAAGKEPKDCDLNKIGYLSLS